MSAGRIFLLLALVLAACSSPPQETAVLTAQPTMGAAATEMPGSLTPSQTPTVEPSEALTSTASVVPVEGNAFQNPVIKNDFPDPFILPVGDQYYAYATNSSGRNIQVAVSEDLVTWKLLTDAMPALPTWAALRGGLVWAPEVIQIGEQFVLYFTARDKESNRQCIGVATSENPEGKFRDTRSEPLVCQETQGGSIDPSPYRSGDDLYLYWKNDGNCCARTTWIYVQELAPDGLSLVGEPVQLVSNDKPWEGAVIEAPTMVAHEDSFYLFYSGNSYGGVEYAIGYATCETPLGPCEDSSDNPLVESLLEKPPVIGPGHQTVIRIGEQDWLVYHAWEVTPQGLKTDRRFVWMDRLEWENGEPVVRGPTTGPQPAPAQED